MNGSVLMVRHTIYIYDVESLLNQYQNYKNTLENSNKFHYGMPKSKRSDNEIFQNVICKSVDRIGWSEGLLE